MGGMVVATSVCSDMLSLKRYGFKPHLYTKILSPKPVQNKSNIIKPVVQVTKTTDDQDFYAVIFEVCGCFRLPRY